MRTFRRKPADRAGYTLALFAMFFFGMMGLAALVIDIAFVRSAQRRMQTAVDSAALEGLRLGRQNASDMVANVFDDNFNPQDGDPNNYGAGPEVQYGGGWPRWRHTPRRRSSFRPAGLQADRSTAGRTGDEPSSVPSGDMSAGTYNTGQPSAEADNYTRADFSYGSSGSNSFWCGCAAPPMRKGWTTRRALAPAVHRFPGFSAAVR